MKLAATNSPMRICYHCLLFLFLSLPEILRAQESDDTSIVRELDQVVVTATRTERKLGNVAVPVQLISRTAIRNAGSLRLNDILSEQTGLFITSGGASSSAGGGVFGNGVQIQGLSPDYTMILIDGEPLTGRQGGVIDLSRISVNNIRRIEIVKGPSSSLYGSEAMGGVVNIITEQAEQSGFQTGLRYGRFHSVDANVNASVRNRKFGMQLFGNRNSSRGFDLDETSPGKTVDPYRNYTGQLKFHFLPFPRTRISLSTRFFNEDQKNHFPTTDLGSGAQISIVGNGIVRDLNVNPVITHQFHNNFRTALRLFFSRYEYEQDLVKEQDKSPYYYDFFQQDFYRGEMQADFKLQESHAVSIGGGWVREVLNTTRYEDRRKMDNRYLFLQDEWQLGGNLRLIGGIRFDDNTAYRSRLSPKLAVHYKARPGISFTASYGGGFKAPDFRQMFLNFLNTAAGGYVIYGANEINIAEIERQYREGILSELLPRAYDLSQLHPEISNGFNAGTRVTLNDRLSFDLNFFRNDIRNLIQVEIIAYRSNGAPVYSYFNVREAFTQGVEWNAAYRLDKHFTLNGGYQFLSTADKEHLKRIREGTVFTRDPQTNESYRVRRGDYAGLPNRSAHLANLKLTFDNQKGWSGTLRGIYRSRWGTTDRDGNEIINRDDEFAPGFLTANFSIAHEKNAFRFQAGVDNIFNYRDPLHLPAQAGIQPYISVTYSFINKKQSIK